MSYPNQKKIKIHKPKYDDAYVEEKGAFMQLGIDEWQEVFKRYCKGKEEKTSVLGLYLYLASNADGYEKWLSPSAYINATGKSRASYYRALSILEEDGYIYKDAGGRLNFATTPQKSSEVVCHDWDRGDSKMRQSDLKEETDESQECDSAVSRMNREINNIDNHKEEKIIKDKAPFSDLSYLKERVSPLGEYDGRRLEDDIMGFWSFDERTQIEQIEKKTVFSKEEAIYIVRHILDRKKRMALLELERIAFMEDE